MANAHDQAENESFILTNFLDVACLTPSSIHRGPSLDGNSNPDFVVCIEGKQVGIEETTYYRQQRVDELRPRQATESAWDDLRKVIARTKHRHKELEEIHASISFRNFRLPPPREHEAFADELVGFAVQERHALENVFHRFTKFGGQYRLLNGYIEYAEIRQAGCKVLYWDWRHNAEHVGLKEDELLDIIKTKTVRHVRAEFDENWLLITSRTETSQQMGPLSAEKLNGFENVRHALANGPFDKVYIYDYTRRKVVCWSAVLEGWTLLTDGA